MKYELFNCGAYNLHFIKTKKFKTITIEVNFRREVRKEEITTRNLLKMLLLYSTNDYKSEKELIKATEELYDLKLFSYINRIGNYSNLSFKVRFLNEKFTEKNLNKESILFLLNIIFNPNIENNSFNDEAVLLCKENLRKVILSEKDDKIKYTLRNLLETTKDKPYSYNPFGEIEDLDKIDSHNLYSYYKSILNNDLIDIFVVGDIDTNSIKELFKSNFKVETFKKNNINLSVKELIPRKRITKYSIPDTANQTIFTLLCSLNGLTDFEKKSVVKVYNEILGGSANSLLFDTVREKKSYAYFINSIVKPYDNNLMIYSGIEKENINEVLRLVKKTLTNMTKGNFKDEVLESAKKSIISSFKTSTDSPNSIINIYYARVLFNNGEIEERIANVSKVTKNDVINLAKKISLHTLLVLEGGDSSEKN